MTDTNKLDILKHLQDELKLKFNWRFSIKDLSELLSLYNTTAINEDTISQALTQINNQISEMPEPIEVYTGKPIRKLTNEGWKKSQNKKIVYKGLSEYESQEVKNKIATLNLHRIIFEEMHPIVKLLGPQEITTSSGPEKKISKQEGKLIDLILDIVVMGFIKEDEYKKYSLRNIADEVTKKGYEIDHSTLGYKFNTEKFKWFLNAGILRKKDSLKKPDDLDSIESFRKWFELVFMTDKPTYKKSTNQKSIRKNDEITDTATGRKSGKSGLHPGLIQDDLEAKWGIDEQQNDDRE